MGFRKIFRFLIPIFVALSKIEAINEYYNKLENHWTMCSFLLCNVYEGADPENVENIATIQLGDLVAVRAERIWEADMDDDSDEEAWASDNVCVGIKRSMKVMARKFVNPVTYWENETGKMKGKLDRCVHRLARKAGRSLTLYVRINSNDDGSFTNLMKMGRELVASIKFYPEFDLGTFYFEMAAAIFTPFATQFSMVKDIMIGTKNAGYWNKKLFLQFFIEEYFNKLTYKKGAKPYWQWMLMVPPGKYAIVQMCQWPAQLGYGQKFRARYALSDEEGLAAWLQWINDMLNPPDPEICF